VQRLALLAHCFTSAGVSLALLQEAHLSSAVKRLAVLTQRLVIAGLRRSRADREAGNQHSSSIFDGRVLPAGLPKDFDRDSDGFIKGLSTGHRH
jgi:hypothetical protein